MAQRIGTLPIWEGEKPEAGDLLKQLEDPIQLRVLRHHTEATENVFQLDESTGALSPEQLREDVTAMTLADIPRRTVKLAIEKTARKAKKSRRRHARRFGAD